MKLVENGCMHFIGVNPSLQFFKVCGFQQERFCGTPRLKKMQLL
jgi:hypothetical protein